MSDKLKKLQELMQIANDGPSKQDFLDNFKVIIDFVKKLQTANKEEMVRLNDKYSETVNQTIKNIEDYSKNIISETQKETMDYCKQEMGKMMMMCEEKMEEVENGKDGEDADEDIVAEKASKIALEALKPLIPSIEAIEQDLPKLGEPIRDALELLKGEERLDVSAIKGIEEMVRNLTAGLKSNFVMGGGGVGKHNVAYYDLSASLDGSTRTFTLPAFYKILDIKLNSVPVMRLTTDYTVDQANSQITFTSAISDNDISAGQSCIILYSEN